MSSKNTFKSILAEIHNSQSPFIIYTLEFYLGVIFIICSKIFGFEVGLKEFIIVLALFILFPLSTYLLTVLKQK